jgi:hypothetical protein
MTRLFFHFSLLRPRANSDAYYYTAIKHNHNMHYMSSVITNNHKLYTVIQQPIIHLTSRSSTGSLPFFLNA